MRFIGRFVALLLLAAATPSQAQPKSETAKPVIGKAEEPNWDFKPDNFCETTRQARQAAEQEALAIRAAKAKNQKALEALKANPGSEAARLALLNEAVSSIEVVTSGMHRILQHEKLIEAAFKNDNERIQRHRSRIATEAKEALQRVHAAKANLADIQNRTKKELLEGADSEPALALFREERLQQRVIYEQEKRTANHAMQQKIIDECEALMWNHRFRLVGQFESMKDARASLAATTHTFEVVNSALATQQACAALADLKTIMGDVLDTRLQDSLDDSANILVGTIGFQSETVEPSAERSDFERWRAEKLAAMRERAGAGDTAKATDLKGGRQ